MPSPWGRVFKPYAAGDGRLQPQSLPLRCGPPAAEHAMDPEYAGNLGVNLDELLISQPDSGEQALEIAETLVRSNSVDVIVIDSVAALVPRAELDGEMGDSHMGLQARLMSQALRKLAGIVSSSRTTFIFINQLREKIGVFFGSPETTTGGVIGTVWFEAVPQKVSTAPPGCVGRHVSPKDRVGPRSWKGYKWASAGTTQLGGTGRHGEESGDFLSGWMS